MRYIGMPIRAVLAGIVFLWVLLCSLFDYGFWQAWKKEGAGKIWRWVIGQVNDESSAVGKYSTPVKIGALSVNEARRIVHGLPASTEGTVDMLEVVASSFPGYPGPPPV